MTMRAIPVALLAVGLTWAGVARAETPPADTGAPADEQEPGVFDDLPELPPPPTGSPDQAPQEWRYNGPHAIHADVGGGWCDIREPHAHPYPPFDELLFQEDNGGYDFLGDPTDFGYEGTDLFWYEAEHPIAVGWGLGWCYLTWPHRHQYRPGPGYAACGSYWCYRGVRDPSYWRERARWSGFVLRYPTFYWSREYYRTRVPASPGRWASVHPRRAAAPAGVRPGARPGGVARPIALPQRRTAGPVGFAPPRRTVTIPHRTAAPRVYSVPRSAPSRGVSLPWVYLPPRAYAPPRAPAPRGYSAAPTRSSERDFAPARGHSPPRAGWPGPRASSPSPRAWSPARASSPSPRATSHAASSHRPSTSHSSSSSHSGGGSRHR
jgi:hypothetical protein